MIADLCMMNVLFFSKGLADGKGKQVLGIGDLPISPD
jgi:hypothetical protein